MTAPKDAITEAIQSLIKAKDLIERAITPAGDDNDCVLEEAADALIDLIAQLEGLEL
jgi:hypothetical protein